MVEIVLYPWRLFLCHTGLASATTSLRNLIDKSSGVLTSTFAWIRFSMAEAMAVISKRVIPSAASIKRSRSLTSVSSRCNTEPKTRGFNPRFAATMIRTGGFLRGGLPERARASWVYYSMSGRTSGVRELTKSLNHVEIRAVPSGKMPREDNLPTELGDEAPCSSQPSGDRDGWDLGKSSRGLP